jgi:hypothetical protein
MTMAKQKLWSLSALATEMQINVRTAARMLAGVEPDGKIGRHAAWFLSSAIGALSRYQAQSDRMNGRRVAGSTGAVPDPVLGQLQDLADQIASGLRRLRESDPGEPRLAVLRDFGPAVGALDKALQRSAASQGADAAAVLAPFRDALMGETVREIIDLVGAG